MVCSMINGKRIYRKQSEKMIGGVCAGLAEYLNVDVVLVRLIFAALALVNGIGLVAYLVLWLIMPNEEQLEQGAAGDAVVRANVNEMKDEALRLGQQVKEVGSELLHGKEQAATPPEEAKTE